MQPVVNRLEDEYSNQATVVSLDAKGDGEAAFEELFLPGHPSIVLFDSDGNEVYRGVGVIEESQLRQELDMLLDDSRATTSP
jgi:hypothetical protein